MAHCAYCGKYKPDDESIRIDQVDNLSKDLLWFCDRYHFNCWDEDQRSMQEIIEPVNDNEEPIEPPEEPVTTAKPTPKRRGRPPKARP